jgi:hypothetical protein
MDRDQAKERAMEFINANIPHYAGQLLISDPHTIDTGDTWIFYYEHRKYFEGEERRHVLYGNLPIEVPKDGGAIKKVPLARHFLLKSKFGRKDIEW